MVVLGILIVVPLGMWFWRNKYHPPGYAEPSQNLLRACPSRWSRERLGSLGSDGVREYLVIDGQEYAVEAVDTAWVRSKCSIKQPDQGY